MSLFQSGHFILAGGDQSDFKIDCDYLSDEDIENLAFVLQKRLPPFGSVEGVPRGGLRLAKALEKWITEGPLLIVDDVYTTGGSIRRHCGNREAFFAVIFSRCVPHYRLPEDVFALFTLK